MKKQTFLQGSVVLIVSALITKLIGAFFKIPLTNMLGGIGMGYFSSAYGLFLPVYAVSVTGLTTAVARLVAESSAFSRYANARKIMKTALLRFMLIGIAGSALVFVGAIPFSRYVVGSEQAYIAVFMIAPSILFGCIMAVYRGYYEGLRNMYPTAFSQVAESVVKLASGLILCSLILTNSEYILGYFPDGTDIYAVAAGGAVLGITLSSSAGAAYLFLRHSIRGDGVSVNELERNSSTDSSREISIALFRVLIPVALGSLVTNMTSLIDLATIIRCVSGSVGRFPEYYSAHYPDIESSDIANFIYGSFNGLAVTVFNLVPSVTNMFGKGVLPNIAEAWAAGDSDRIKRNAESVLSATSFIAVPSGIGITVLSEQILHFLYPQRIAETAAAALSLRYLGIGVIMLALSFPVFSMLQGTGRERLPVKLMLIGVAVKLVGNFLLVPVPELNGAGAAISTVLCYSVILVMALSAFVKHTGTKPDFKKIFAAPVFAGILCGATAYLSSNIIGRCTQSRLVLPVSVAAGGIVYLGVMYLLKNKNNV